MNKKILIVFIIGLIAFTAAGFFVFKYSREVKTAVENSANTEEEESGLEIIGSPQAEIETTQGVGLFVCVDKCGDGVCQLSDPECEDNLNCVCGETKEECPADCR